MKRKFKSMLMLRRLEEHGQFALTLARIELTKN